MKFVYIVINNNGVIFGCFSSLKKAKKYIKNNFYLYIKKLNVV
jgi:hypothetical protein